jgi:hypothetical protein
MLRNISASYPYNSYFPWFVPKLSLDFAMRLYGAILQPISMISLATARQLKEAGLIWTPALHDFFIIPDRGLDDRVFVINEMNIGVERMQGQPMFTFQGVSEWALDYVLTTEAIWLPTEEQVRQALEQHLLGEAPPALKLFCLAEGYRCEIRFGGTLLTFEAPLAVETYAAALLHTLKTTARAH